MKKNDLDRRSAIDEPYEYISGGALSGEDRVLSPDPLVSYVWEDDSDDELQIYIRRPVEAAAEPQGAFSALESAASEQIRISVGAKGSITLDFGTECAGWLEVDIPDLSGEITLGVSEYNAPSFVNKNSGTKHSSKTAPPVRYGDTYRLELNDELYEGVRYGFINVLSVEAPFCITDIRLVCQVKRANYKGSFECDNEMAGRIWYTAAYDVRVNLKKDYFAAILMDRGDRFSWTGDAYPSQAAALVAFANYDFVLKNLHYTSIRGNGIESYELYWIFSLVDYYEHTADKNGVRSLLSQAESRLEHALAAFDSSPPLGFFGWDERLGAGFENPDTKDNRLSYKFLCIRAWSEFSRVLDDIGEKALADRYRGYAEKKKGELQLAENWYSSLGIHAVADAINSGILQKEDIEAAYEAHFTNRVNRLSYSPFNQYFILQAMAKAGKYDDALSVILDMYGGQIEYGATTFFEVYRPQWNDIIAKNAPVPNSQVGYTSLAHPWGAGVLAWMSEEILGIRAEGAGFKTFSITPHLGSQLRRVSGEMPTPQGTIAAAVDLDSGIFSFSAPAGTRGTVGIPKAHGKIAEILVEGPAAEAGENEEFVYYSVSEGSTVFHVCYEGKTPEYTPPEYVYPAEFSGADAETGGAWEEKYGSDGYLLCSYLGDGRDLRVLPDYVENISAGHAKALSLPAAQDDTRALHSNPCGTGERAIGAYASRNPYDCLESFTVDIDTKDGREYTVSLYFVDWEREGRELEVEMFDGVSYDLIAPPVAVHDCKEGVYLTFRYDRSARFRIYHIRGSNVTLSGIFFGGRADAGVFLASAGSVMIDDSSKKIEYSGEWEHSGSFADAYGGSISYSRTRGDSASVTFEGTGFAYYASSEFNRGIAEVCLDGRPLGKFDLYNPSRIKRQKLICSEKHLEQGVHTLTVTVTGEKNQKASDAYIDIDAIEVFRR